jgi:predicted protein tyrosine phosphatase
MSTYYNDITDWLTVGTDLYIAEDITGQTYAETIAELRTHGVTHVLDTRIEWEDKHAWRSAGLPFKNYKHLPIDDSWRHTPDESWFAGVEKFVTRFRAEASEGDRLYVHCHMGINRAPSAAMLALLTVDPEMDPFVAFRLIRKARPIAGLVYAEHVGIRHLRNKEGAQTASNENGQYESVTEFSKALSSYWTPELRKSVHAGIAYYRSKEGSVTTVG